MAEKKTQTQNDGTNSEITYKTPWKMLGIFAILFLGIIVYGFMN